MFAVVVELSVRPKQADAFLQLAEENARVSLREEPGCRQFDVASDPARAGEVFLYELYDDADAFETHLRTAHFARFDAATAGMVVQKVVITYARVVQ